jgi:hypothetical protein
MAHEMAASISARSIALHRLRYGRLGDFLLRRHRHRSMEDTPSHIDHRCSGLKIWLVYIGRGRDRLGIRVRMV